MSALALFSVIILLSVMTTVFLVLYLKEYNKRKQLQKDGDKILEEFKNKGLNLLQDSMKKSQDLLNQAEAEGIKVVSSTQSDTKKLEDMYSKDLAEALTQSQNSVDVAQSQVVAFFGQLSQRAANFQSSSEQVTRDRINQMFSDLEDKLSEFLMTTEQKTISSIELEIKGARELIESYKQQQLSLIDENIIAMMEQTLNIVLSKKLSLKDQLDLVYEALERAKVEKFVV